MNRTLRWACLALLSGGLLMVGCGKAKTAGRPKTVPVFGTVTLNGQPVAEAQVVFQAKGKSPSATGLTDSSGKYRLMTFDVEGAVPGEYAVAIFKYDQSSLAPPSSSTSSAVSQGGMPDDYVPPGIGAPIKPSGPKNLLPAKYADAKTSGLTATVKESGENKFDFTLE